ncbi:MAG: NADH-quinone oxidoreductase subunit M [Deltaproteobacteria bacterium]|nr:NADH-quinone oxidoreductase subunit M [Deltaproteobacteria bacterium]
MLFQGILTGVVFIPFAAALVILLGWIGRAALGRSGPSTALDNFARGVAGLGTLGAFVMALVAWGGFDTGTSELQFVDHFVWIRSFNVEFFLGVDGLSIALILLTGFISLIAWVASIPHEHADDHHFSRRAVAGYQVMFLILQTGMYGTFLAQDVFLFYVFWEVMLLPMYFLIGIWGGPRKEYAAIKFFLYTLAGSVLMLLAIIALYYNSPAWKLVDGTDVAHTFSMVGWKWAAQSGVYASVDPILGFTFTHVVWLGLFIGFSIKVPIFPFHTWLPDAHVEAPTPISVILAGILLKTGGYGIFRFCLGFLPESTEFFAGFEGGVPLLPVIGTVSIVYAAMVCMGQTDLKKLIAYSSVSHMGFVLLGLSALTPQGLSGAMFVMIAHGVVSPMLFLIVGVVYDRAHHRNIEGFGGLAKQVPEYTGLMGLAFFASLGLPGLAGFIGEVTVFLGAFAQQTIYVAISATAVIITAAYYLWAIQRVFLGGFNTKYEKLPDVVWIERLTLYPLAIVTIVLGFWPAPIFEMVNVGLFALLK